MRRINLSLSLIILAICGIKTWSDSDSTVRTPATFNKELVVEFRRPLMKEELKAFSSWAGVSRIQKFDPFPSPYFDRVYRITASMESESLAQKLMHHPLVRSVEKNHQIKLFSILPANDPNPRQNDTFYNYQWALENKWQPSDDQQTDPHKAKGQVLVYYKTDDRIITVTGRPLDGGSKPYDIQRGPVFEKIEQALPREALVAVLDSGVDWDHPELSGVIFKNTVECGPNGNIINQPKEDKDNNGYKGDCIGWNFTTDNPRMANRPRDDLGHGTHLAGIISALRNNSQGIAGVSGRIKILPLKVVSATDEDKEGEESLDEESSVGFTIGLAKAIRYATAMKADVINLSLGWPLVADTEYVRQALKEALEHGVVIVAAAGNNSNGSQVFPCAHEGVICVGSSDNNGGISAFSNYGGHVDILAPGARILSLYPTFLSSISFAAKGYGVSTGTSQAAPFVSALSAVMKVGLGADRDEIYARLHLGARKAVGDKGVMGGTVQYDESLSVKPQPLVVPIFKEMDRFTFKMKSQRFSFRLPIENKWQTARNVQISVTSEKEHIRLAKNQFTIGQLDRGQRKILNVEGSLTNLKADSEFSLTVTVKYNGQSKSYWHKVFISRDLGEDSELISLPIVKTLDSKMRLKPVKDVQVSREAYTDFYTTQTTEEGLNLTVLQAKGNHLSSIDLGLPGVKQIYNVYRADLNYDGVSDYYVLGLEQKDQTYYIVSIYLNRQLKPLLGQYSHWRFKLDTAPFDFKIPRFSSYSDPAMGRVAIPVFLTEGYIPEEDKNPDYFAFEDTNTFETSLYYLEPRLPATNEVTARLRKYNNYLIEKKWREQFDLHYQDDIQFINLMPQTEEDYALGRIYVVVRIGNPARTNYQILDLKEADLRQRNLNFAPSSLSGVFLDNNSVSSVYDLTGLPHESAEVSFIDYYQKHSLRVVGVSTPQFQSSHYLEYRSEDTSTIITNYLQSYRVGQKIFSLFETGDNTTLLVKEPNGKVKEYQRQVIRSTFLPGRFFSEVFAATYIKSKNGFLPAMFIDESKLTSRHVMIWTLNEAGLSVPLDMNVEVPKGCSVLPPARWGHDGQMAMMFPCVNGEKSVVKILPIE